MSIKSVLQTIGYGPLGKKLYKKVGGYLSGGQEHTGDVSLQTKNQRKFTRHELSHMGTLARENIKQYLQEPSMSQALQGNMLGRYLNPAARTYRDLAQPQDTEAAFQKSIVDPLMQQYTQRILPSIYGQLGDLNASASSAVNRQLAQSANDLNIQMGQYYMPFLQQQQQQRLQAAQGLSSLTTPLMNYYGQGQTNRLNALNLLNTAAGQQAIQPMVNQREGLAGPLLQAGGTIAAASMMSSEKVKENIKPYSKGLDEVNKLEVKQYDYIQAVGGARDKVGLIAEKVPEEIQANVNGILGVDVYGLVSLLVNAVKDLSHKVDNLEKKAWLAQ